MRISWINVGKLAASPTPISLEDLQSLKAQGISAIVTLTEHPLTTWREITPDALAALGFTVLHAPINDGQAPDLPTMQAVTEFIDSMSDQGCATLIHCAAGVGRTGTALHAYYLLHGLPLADAQAKIKKGRRESSYVILSDSQRAFLTQLDADQRASRPE